MAVNPNKAKKGKTVLRYAIVSSIQASVGVEWIDATEHRSEAKAKQVLRRAKRGYAKLGYRIVNASIVDDQGNRTNLPNP